MQINLVEKYVSRLKMKVKIKPIKSKIDRMRFRSKFGDSSLIGRWVMVRTSSKWGKIWFSSLIWPWRSRSIIPKNNRGPKQGVLHLWSKFGNPSLNERRVIVRTSSWLIHTHRHIDPQTQSMTIPEGQNWSRVKIAQFYFSKQPLWYWKNVLVLLQQ